MGKLTRVSTVHGFAGIVAFCLVTVFLGSTIVTELIRNKTHITAVKQWIVYGLVLLVPAMAATGITGRLLTKHYKLNPNMRKAKRMKILAGNAILVLMPAAFYLGNLSAAGEYGHSFWAVQALELLAGAFNWTLLLSNLRDGRRLRLSFEKQVHFSESTVGN